MTLLKTALVGGAVLAVIIILATRAGKAPTSDAEPYGTGTPEPSASVLASASATPTLNTMNDKHEITISTNHGDITFRTYDADAPKTVENFITLARKGFYEGVIFHRVISGFMIQGGDPTGTGSGGPGYKFADELTPNTESAKKGYVKGTVAMANAGANTNGSQFFIMHADYPLPHNYTIFGHVVKGQDVVDKIAATPTGAGDRPVSPVTMTKVTVTDL